MNNLTTWDTVWRILTYMLGAAVSLSIIIKVAAGSWKSGRNEREKSELEIQNLRNERTDKEIAELRSLLKESAKREEHYLSQISALQSQLAAQQKDNSELREYIRLDRVPPAMAEAFNVLKIEDAKTQRMVLDLADSFAHAVDAMRESAKLMREDIKNGLAKVEGEITMVLPKPRATRQRVAEKKTA